MASQQEKRQGGTPLSDGTRKEIYHLLQRGKDVLRRRPVVQGITIDGPTSKDLDDALWLEERADGGLTLLVSITDVGALVRPNETPALDRDARERGFTRYLSHGSRPMLPRSLSEQALSLLPGEPRPTITLSLPLDTQFQLLQPSISLTALTSQKRFSYDEVEEELAHPTPTFGPMIQRLSRLCQALLQQRRAAGALALYDLLHGWATTEEGTLVPLSSGQRNHAHIIVQECMILANQAFATYLAERGVPALYRNHAAKSIAPPRAALLQMLDNAMNHPELISPERLKATTALVLERAVYAPTVEGHFGLNLPVYTHMTSPLRRYPDLLNQRILHALLRGKTFSYTLADLAEIATGINTTEREIKEAKKAYFLDAYDESLQQEVSRANDAGASRPLAQLDARLFHSVLRMSAEAGVLAPETKEELLHRLAAEQLAANDLFLLLYRYTTDGEDWDEVKEAAISHVCEHPHHAVSLLMMGQQNLGWAEPHYHVRVLSSTGPFEASVRVQIAQHVYQSASYTASSKAEARQLAAADVATQIAGFTFDEREETLLESNSQGNAQTTNPEAAQQLPSSKDPSLARQISDIDLGEKNVVAALNELEQKRAVQKVTYRYESVGSQREPAFTCTCTVIASNGERYEASARGRSKKEATQQAALRCWQQLTHSSEENGR